MSWYDELQPAEFAGHRFGVVSTQIAGGVTSADQVVLGTGSRKRPVASAPRTHTFEAYLVGGDVLPRCKALAARLEAGSGLLVHPHFGSSDAVCERYSVAFRERMIEFAEISLEFGPAELPPTPPTPTAGLTAPVAIELIVAEASEFSDELLPAEELGAVAPDLGIELEPPELMTAEVTRRLIASPGVPRSGLAGGLQSLGSGLRLVEAGQLLASDRDAVSGLLLREATRTDSVVVMRARQLWLELAREQGAADDRRVDGGGRSLAALAVVGGIELADLAAKNRALGRGWFGQGEVQL